MANNSGDAPLAWVWSEYRAELSGGGRLEPVEVVTVAERVPAEGATSVVGSLDASPAVAAPPAARAGGEATGLMLAALILAILGLLWFASADKKPAAPAADTRPAPAVSSEPAPVAPPAPTAAAPPVVSAPAEPEPASSPAAAAPEPEKPVHHRQRRHR